MRALRYHGPNDLRYEDTPDPAPRAGEVRIRVGAAGICGSDVQGYLGVTGRRIPVMTMGHEFAGEVVELGEGVEGIRIGDRVACFPFGFDGVCAACISGDYSQCENRVLYGVLKDDGAFADFLCVAAGACVRLADGVSFAEGALIEPLTVGLHAVSQLSDADISGKTVLVVGAGSIGLMTVLCLAMKNPAALVVADIADNRLEIARRLGATHALNPLRDDVGGMLREMTGGAGADAAFEAVGASAPVRQAMGALRRRGRAVWIGNSQRLVEVDMQEIVTRELRIFGTNAFDLRTFQRAAGYINGGGLDVSPIISHCAPMRDGPELFKKLADNPGDWVKGVLTNDAGT